MKKVWILSIVSIPNFFDTCHHTTHNISHHTICKRAELMSKIYKNGLLKKKIRTKVQKSVFLKNSVQKSVQKRIKKKSVLVRTNPYEWEHCWYHIASLHQISFTSVWSEVVSAIIRKGNLKCLSFRYPKRFLQN